MKLAENQVKQIWKFALDYYKKLDKAHNVWHAFKTVELASYLAKKEKANIQICELGALLHQFHPENIKTVERFLKKIDIDKNTMQELLHCVYCVDRKTIHKAKTLEAKVVFDADKLQAVGPFGLVREFSYREGLANIDFIRATPIVKEVQMSCYKKLQTKTAKKMAKKPYELAIRFLEEVERFR